MPLIRYSRVRRHSGTFSEHGVHYVSINSWIWDSLWTAVRPLLETHRYRLAQVTTLGLRSLKSPLMCVTPCRRMGLVDLKHPKYSTDPNNRVGTVINFQIICLPPPPSALSRPISRCWGYFMTSGPGLGDSFWSAKVHKYLPAVVDTASNIFFLGGGGA